MTMPTQSLEWASNTDYATGSEMGNPTKSEPASGRKEDGWSPETKPVPQEFNWVINAVFVWLSWLVDSIATISRNRFPTPIFAINYAATTSGVYGSPILEIGLNSATTGSYVVDLDVPVGYKLGTLTINELSLVTTGTTVFNILRIPVGDTAAVDMGTLTLATTPITATDYTMNLLAESATQSFSAASGGVYTRSTGSYTSEEFFVGQHVQWSGFSNSGNNVAGIITALSGTSMTIDTTGQTVETATAQVNGTSPTTDGTFSIQLWVSATIASDDSAHAQANKDLRYTIVPQ